MQFDQTSLSKKAHVITVPASQLRSGANTIVISRHGQGALRAHGQLLRGSRTRPGEESQHHRRMTHRLHPLTSMFSGRNSGNITLKKMRMVMNGTPRTNSM